MDWVRQIKKIGGVGIVNKRDIEDFTAAELEVLSLMVDQLWHSTAEITRVTGYQAQALRRMRTLRGLRWVKEIDRARVTGRRVWRYRMILDVEALMASGKPLEEQ